MNIKIDGRLALRFALSVADEYLNGALWATGAITVGVPLLRLFGVL